MDDLNEELWLLFHISSCWPDQLLWFQESHRYAARKHRPLFNRRGKSNCKMNHPRTKENTNKRGGCKLCHRIAARESYRRVGKFTRKKKKT